MRSWVNKMSELSHSQILNMAVWKMRKYCDKFHKKLHPPCARALPVITKYLQHSCTVHMAAGLAPMVVRRSQSLLHWYSSS